MEIRRWFTYFILDELDHNSMDKKHCGILCGIEEHIFIVIMEEKIIMGSLHEYIKEWVGNGIAMVSKLT